MRRRDFGVRVVKAALALATTASGAGVLAQRPSQPIARPPRPGVPGRPRGRGRFYESGMNDAPAPGVFTVAAVNTRDNILQLRDESGNTADVFVSPRLFDLETLKPGDEVAVDFFVPGDNDDRLEAASIDKLGSAQ